MPNIVVEPQEPLVQKALTIFEQKYLSTMDSQAQDAYRKVNTIKVEQGSPDHYGEVRSDAPNTINISVPKIKSTVSDEAEIINQIVLTIAHELGHLAANFQGGEVPAESAENKVRNQMVSTTSLLAKVRLASSPTIGNDPLVEISRQFESTADAASTVSKVLESLLSNPSLRDTAAQPQLDRENPNADIESAKKAISLFKALKVAADDAVTTFSTMGELVHPGLNEVQAAISRDFRRIYKTFYTAINTDLAKLRMNVMNFNFAPIMTAGEVFLKSMNQVFETVKKQIELEVPRDEVTGLRKKLIGLNTDIADRQAKLEALKNAPESTDAVKAKAREKAIAFLEQALVVIMGEYEKGKSRFLALTKKPFDPADFISDEPKLEPGTKKTEHQVVFNREPKLKTDVPRIEYTDEKRLLKEPNLKPSATKEEIEARIAQVEKVKAEVEAMLEHVKEAEESGASQVEITALLEELAPKQNFYEKIPTILEALNAQLELAKPFKADKGFKLDKVVEDMYLKAHRLTQAHNYLKSLTEKRQVARKEADALRANKAGPGIVANKDKEVAELEGKISTSKLRIADLTAEVRMLGELKVRLEERDGVAHTPDPTGEPGEVAPTDTIEIEPETTPALSKKRDEDEKFKPFKSKVLDNIKPAPEPEEGYSPEDDGPGDNMIKALFKRMRRKTKNTAALRNQSTELTEEINKLRKQKMSPFGGKLPTSNRPGFRVEYDEVGRAKIDPAMNELLRTKVKLDNAQSEKSQEVAEKTLRYMQQLVAGEHVEEVPDFLGSDMRYNGKSNEAGNKAIEQMARTKAELIKSHIEEAAKPSSRDTGVATKTVDENGEEVVVAPQRSSGFELWAKENGLLTRLKSAAYQDFLTLPEFIQKEIRTNYKPIGQKADKSDKTKDVFSYSGLNNFNWDKYSSLPEEQADKLESFKALVNQINSTDAKVKTLARQAKPYFVASQAGEDLIDNLFGGLDTTTGEMPDLGTTPIDPSRRTVLRGPDQRPTDEVDILNLKEQSEQAKKMRKSQDRDPLSGVRKDYMGNPLPMSDKEKNDLNSTKGRPQSPSSLRGKIGPSDKAIVERTFDDLKGDNRERQEAEKARQVEKSRQAGIENAKMLADRAAKRANVSAARAGQMAATMAADTATIQRRMSAYGKASETDLFKLEREVSLLALMTQVERQPGIDPDAVDAKRALYGKINSLIDSAFGDHSKAALRTLAKYIKEKADEASPEAYKVYKGMLDNVIVKITGSHSRGQEKDVHNMERGTGLKGKKLTENKTKRPYGRK